MRFIFFYRVEKNKILCKRLYFPFLMKDHRLIIRVTKKWHYGGKERIIKTLNMTKNKNDAFQIKERSVLVKRNSRFSIISQTWMISSSSASPDSL